jgi:hypothetical protein
MFTTLFTLIALLMLGWAIWFIVEFFRYIVSGQYKMDQRLQQFKR